MNHSRRNIYNVLGHCCKVFDKSTYILLIVHGIGAKLVSNWEQNMLYSKSLQILRRKITSMLTGLKVSPLARKYVIYRPEHNAKDEPHGIEF